MLAGTVERVEPLGKQYRSVIKLFGKGSQVIVISGEPPDVTVNAPVVVAGVLVSDATKNLRDYEGSDELVVWSAIIARPAINADPSSP